MNGLKRLLITVKTRLDGIVDDFENHEAVAGVAIKDLEAWRGQTRIHQHRLQKMIGQYEANLAELATEAAAWSARAVKMKASDEAKALQCVKRLLQTQQQAKLIANQLHAAQQQLAQLEADLSAIQTQLHTLDAQKAVFAARQNRLQMQASLKSGYGNPLDEAKKVFSRWEENLVGAEFATPEPMGDDPLADHFNQEEERLALQMMLDELAAQAAPPTTLDKSPTQEN